MANIHNFTDGPIQIRLLDGKIADIPQEQCPITIADITPAKSVIPLTANDEQEPIEIAIIGNKFTLRSEEGFPAPKPHVYYIVDKEIVEVLRKLHRGVSDLLIAEQTSRGYHELRRANMVTELDFDDEATMQTARKTWDNSFGNLKYDVPAVNLHSER
ncbi:hypothetical protein IJF93_00145 [Candidatus Saccharibacteria bacterium]|nr:hypothetical protein [Candidatus Saccharibacteria bacterium]